MIATIKNNCWV